MIAETALSLVLALLLDWTFGEIRRWHPLVGFGNVASQIESVLNQSGRGNNVLMILGVSGWLLAVVPLVLVAYLLALFLSGDPFCLIVTGGLFLYFAIGWRSLISHAKAISEPLKQGNLPAARKAVGMIVSRDTSDLNEEQVAAAATESVLENGADALFAAIFWFAILGIPGVVLYRLSNTLDAMWGYKNKRFLWFGWMAARMDDLLNLIPARLTALSYAIVGNHKQAFASWRKQRGTWKSPNAGPVMSAGAGAINVNLGGGAIYDGKWQERPSLGPVYGNKASAQSIEHSISLVNRALGLWLVIVIFIGLLL